MASDSPEEPSPPIDAHAAEVAAREEHIARLEAKLARPPSVGVLPPVAAIALLGAAWLLISMRADVAYYFSPRTPVQLGAEWDYHFDRLAPNRYVEIHGAPTARGAYLAEAEGNFVAVGLKDTPILVRRATFPHESWKPGKTPPQPDQRAFTVKGRLLRRTDVPRYAEAFSSHDGWGQVNAQWVLLAEEPPGKDFKGMAFFAVVLAFAGINLWLLLRGTLAFLAKKRSALTR